MFQDESLGGGVIAGDVSLCARCFCGLRRRRARQPEYPVPLHRKRACLSKLPLPARTGTFVQTFAFIRHQEFIFSRIGRRHTADVIFRAGLPVQYSPVLVPDNCHCAHHIRQKGAQRNRVTLFHFLTAEDKGLAGTGSARIDGGIQRIGYVGVRPVLEVGLVLLAVGCPVAVGVPSADRNSGRRVYCSRCSVPTYCTSLIISIRPVINPMEPSSPSVMYTATISSNPEPNR